MNHCPPAQPPASIAKQLMTRILAIPGDKQATVLVGGIGSQTFDISKGSTVGYSPAHFSGMLHLMEAGIRNGGAVTVRQYLSIKTERLMPNGKKMWIPEKNVYGVFLGNETYVAVSARSMEHSHNTDAQTGQPLPAEPSVHFVEWPAFVEPESKGRGSRI